MPIDNIYRKMDNFYKKVSKNTYFTTGVFRQIFVVN